MTAPTQIAEECLGSTLLSLFSYAASELHTLLQPFLLRRVKAQVATELPKKTEVVIYHGLSALQKKYYKAILMKDLGMGLWLSEAERDYGFHSESAQ